jgi:plasmid stability protein
MLVCMRTTLNLPDALAEEARKRAAAEGRTFTSLVVEGLRAVLAKSAAPTGPAPRLPASGRGDGKVLVDLTDRDALWDVLDADGLR